MKRLLLLLILSPVVLFGQSRQKAVADSIKAASTNLQRVATVLEKNPGNKIESIQVADSAGYVTLLVRVRVTEAFTIPYIYTQPVAKIKVRNIYAEKVSTVAVPPLPPLVLEADTIVALKYFASALFKTVASPFAKVDTLPVPPLPDIEPALEALPLIAVAPLRLQEIVAHRAQSAEVPELPKFDQLTIELLQPAAPHWLATGIPNTGMPDTLSVPGFREDKLPVEEMHLSDEGYDLLEKLEGFSPTLYSLKDGGFTIGFGFFVPYGEGSKWSKGLTWEQAERLLREKVPAYEDQVKKYINVPLTQKEFDALTMLAYNLGGFSKATSIVNDINGGADFEKLQKDWMRFVHSKAPGVMKGLINRRKDEMQVRSESDYQPERKIQILKK